MGGGKDGGQQGMGYVVVSSYGFFPLANDTALAGRASHDAIYGLFEFAHANFALVTSRSQNSCLVEEVSKISAGKARSLLRQGFERHTRFEGFALGMDL